MLIGAIEAATPRHISGWIHSAAADLGGALLLAFLDDACVGAGRVEIFRQDLADAGLGDGKRGFHFPIVLPRPEDALRVTVRLDLSEAYLLQRNAVLAHASLPRGFLCGELPDGARRAWMLAHGLLNEAEAQALAALADFGVASLALGAEPAEAAARRLFEAVMTGPALAARMPITGALRPALFGADSPAREAGLFALLAEKRLALRVAEGRQLLPGTETGPAELPDGVNHRVDARHLLLLRRWTPFDAAGIRPEHRLDALFPQRGTPATPRTG